jgi:hypothetical protein
VLSFDDVVSHSGEGDFKGWTQSLEKILKGKDPLKFIQPSNLEGITKEVFTDQASEVHLNSFPSKIKKIQFIDLKKYSDELKEIDQALGVENFTFQVRETPDLENIPKNSILHILNPTDEIIELSHDYISYIDVNALLFKDIKLDVERVKDLNQNARFVIDLSHIHNAGGSLVQELTYGIHLYKALLNEGINNNELAFRVSCDSQLFLNIAKLKSLRFMIEAICEQSGVDSYPVIVGTCSLREQTLYDPWNNILRNTTSSMAQILGGANFVSTRPYDYLFSRLTVEKTSTLAYRYGIQTLNILFEESHLAKVMDPTNGSSIVNNLIHSILRNSWESILNWEERDLLRNAKDFAIEVSAIAKARQAEVRKRKKIITGINNFANPDQTMETLYQKPWKPVELSFGHFPLRRLAYEYENLRINYEFSDDRKKGLILTIGKLANINARLNFIQNILDIPALDYDIQDINETIKDKYDFLIFVGADQDYLENISGDFPIDKKYIAGKKELAQIDNEKISELFAGMDILEFLQALLGMGSKND